MNALQTILSLSALGGSLLGGAFWLDDRHEHVDHANQQLQLVENDLKLTARQASMEMIDLRIQILEAQIQAQSLKKDKSPEDNERIERLRKQQDMLREIKIKGKVQ